MDFGNFLNELNEDKGFSVKQVSSKQLNEMAEGTGESAADLKEDAKWYYVPTKEYGGFRHIIVESGSGWGVYYLDQIAGAGKEAADVSGWGDEYEMSRNEERDLNNLRSFLLNEGSGEDNGVNLKGFVVRRKVEGDFATVLKECVEIVKKG